MILILDNKYENMILVILYNVIFRGYNLLKINVFLVWKRKVNQSLLLEGKCYKFVICIKSYIYDLKGCEYYRYIYLKVNSKVVFNCW